MPQTQEPLNHTKTRDRNILIRAISCSFAAPFLDAVLNFSHLISILNLWPTRGRGGTGRRAGLRSLFSQESGSSILLVRTNSFRYNKLRLCISINLGL